MLKAYVVFHSKNKRINLSYLKDSRKPLKGNKEKRLLLRQNKVAGYVNKTNEPPEKVEPADRSRPNIAQDASSRNSSRAVRAITSKSTLRSKQAARQQQKTKQPGSCRQKKEEKRRRGVIQRLYIKGVKRKNRSINSKKDISTSTAKTSNCSIYTVERNGNKTLSTHIKYTYRRKSKYLNSIDRKGKRKGLTGKIDLTSKADEALLKVYNGTTNIIFYKPLRGPKSKVDLTGKADEPMHKINLSLIHI